MQGRSTPSSGPADKSSERSAGLSEGDISLKNVVAPVIGPLPGLWEGVV